VLVWAPRVCYCASRTEFRIETPLSLWAVESLVLGCGTVSARLGLAKPITAAELSATAEEAKTRRWRVFMAGSDVPIYAPWREGRFSQAYWKRFARPAVGSGRLAKGKPVTRNGWTFQAFYKAK